MFGKYSQISYPFSPPPLTLYNSRLNKNKQRDLLSKHMARIMTLIGDHAVVHSELCFE